jgi:hypothetical protein
MMDSGQYVLPVLELELKNTVLVLKKYSGCCFFVGNDHLLVTCRHVLEDNHLPHVQDSNGKSHKILDVWHHPQLDLAVARAPGIGAISMNPLTCRLTLGGDLSAFAYLNHNMDGKFAILPTIAKGYITELPFSVDQCAKGLGKYALSFPSLAGFSGAPVTVFDSIYFAGMLFGNHQSEITVFSNNEVNDDGSIWQERLVRVVDQGTMIGYGEIMKAIDLYRAANPT